MSKLKGLLLTEGMHGMISQAEGLAKALELDYFHEKIELNKFWKLIPANSAIQLSTPGQQEHPVEKRDRGKSVKRGRQRGGEEDRSF